MFVEYGIFEKIYDVYICEMFNKIVQILNSELEKVVQKLNRTSHIFEQNKFL